MNSFRIILFLLLNLAFILAQEASTEASVPVVGSVVPGAASGTDAVLLSLDVTVTGLPWFGNSIGQMLVDQAADAAGSAVQIAVSVAPAEVSGSAAPGVIAEAVGSSVPPLPAAEGSVQPEIGSVAPLISGNAAPAFSPVAESASPSEAASAAPVALDVVGSSIQPIPASEGSIQPDSGSVGPAANAVPSALPGSESASLLQTESAAPVILEAVGSSVPPVPAAERSSQPETGSVAPVISENAASAVSPIAESASLLETGSAAPVVLSAVVDSSVPPVPAAEGPVQLETGSVAPAMPENVAPAGLPAIDGSVPPETGSVTPEVVVEAVGSSLPPVPAAEGSVPPETGSVAPTMPENIAPVGSPAIEASSAPETGSVTPPMPENVASAGSPAIEGASPPETGSVAPELAASVVGSSLPPIIVAESSNAPDERALAAALAEEVDASSLPPLPVAESSNAPVIGAAPSATEPLFISSENATNLTDVSGAPGSEAAIAEKVDSASTVVGDGVVVAGVGSSSAPEIVGPSVAGPSSPGVDVVVAAVGSSIATYAAEPKVAATSATEPLVISPENATNITAFSVVPESEAVSAQSTANGDSVALEVVISTSSPDVANPAVVGSSSPGVVVGAVASSIAPEVAEPPVRAPFSLPGVPASPAEVPVAGKVEPIAATTPAPVAENANAFNIQPEKDIKPEDVPTVTADATWPEDETTETTVTIVPDAAPAVAPVLPESPNAPNAFNLVPQEEMVDTSPKSTYQTEGYTPKVTPLELLDVTSQNITLPAELGESTKVTPLELLEVTSPKSTWAAEEPTKVTPLLEATSDKYSSYVTLSLLEELLANSTGLPEMSQNVEVMENRPDIKIAIQPTDKPIFQPSVKKPKVAITDGLGAERMMHGIPPNSFTRQVSAADKQAFYNIMWNNNLTIEERKSTLEKWAETSGVKPQVVKWEADSATLLNNLNNNITALLNDALQLNEYMFAIMNSENVTIQDIKDTFATLKEENPVAFDIHRLIKKRVFEMNA